MFKYNNDVMNHRKYIEHDIILFSTKKSQASANDLNVAVRYSYYTAIADFVKTANVQKKKFDFTEIVDPMGILFE